MNDRPALPMTRASGFDLGFPMLLNQMPLAWSAMLASNGSTGRGILAGLIWPSPSSFTRISAPIPMARLLPVVVDPRRPGSSGGR